MPKVLTTIKLTKSDIYVWSMKQNKIEMMEMEKKRWKNNITDTKPNIVLECNDSMGGVVTRIALFFLIYEKIHKKL